MYITFQRPVFLAGFQQQPIQKSKTTPTGAISHGITSFHFSGKNAFHTAAQSDSPEEAIQKVLDKRPKQLESKLNAGYAEPGFKEDTMRPIHYLLENPNVTPKAVQLMIDHGVDINPMMNSKNGNKSRYMPYDLFMKMCNSRFQAFKSSPEAQAFRARIGLSPTDDTNLIYLGMPHFIEYRQVQRLLAGKGASIRDLYHPTFFADQQAHDNVVGIMNSLSPLCDAMTSINPPKALYEALTKLHKIKIDQQIPHLIADPIILNGLFQVLCQNGRPLQENINRLKKIILYTLAYDYIGGYPPGYYLKTSNNFNDIYTGKNLEIFKLNFSEMERHKHTERTARAKAEREETTKLLRETTEEIMQNLVLPDGDAVMGGV